MTATIRDSDVLVDSPTRTEIEEAAATAVRSAGAAVAGEFRSLTNDVFNAARDSLAMLADDQRNQVADEIAALGEALRQSAKTLDRRDSPVVASYAEDAGARIEDIAARLRRLTLDETTAHIEDFA